MPYFATSQEFLEQSSLLLEAYPEETRITTKYSYPKPKKQPTALPASTDPTLIATTTTATTSSTTTSASASASTDNTPHATLTLKTYHAPSGICLKYTTDKAAESGG
ncbi:hypothetical protein KEM55_001211 [Ascosphaera atra]|nr:hypothetical protein KEM55_001211 [Ascosphaera atra]